MCGKKCFWIVFMIGFAAITAMASESNPWMKKIEGQIEFQKQLAGLLSQHVPDLEELITIYRDLQITSYQIKRERILYLAEHFPKEIEGLNGLQIDWTEEQEAALLQASQDYGRLVARNGALKEKNQGHPSWPALRAAFSEIRQSKEYVSLHEELMLLLNPIHGIR